MRVASGAKNFHPLHPVTVVLMGDDILRCHRCEKTGPACAGIELGLGSKQRQPATDAGINPRFVLIVKCPAKCRFRSFIARDAILLRRQLLAPFLIRLDYLGRRGERAGLPFIIQQTYLNHNDLISAWGLGRGLIHRLCSAAGCHSQQRSPENDIENGHRRHCTLC